MAGLTIGTDKKNARLFLVAAILFALQLANLIPISFGVFGGIWPIPAIWAILAWGHDGPKAKYGLVLFIAGVFIDIISATDIGTFAAIYIVTYGAYLVHLRFLGRASRIGFMDALIVCAYYVLACLFVGIFVREWPNILALFVPIAATIAPASFMSKLFIIEEQPL